MLRAHDSGQDAEDAVSDTEKAVDATLDLASENQRLRERVAKLEAHVRKGDHFIGAAERAEKAEAERDAALAEVSQLRATISILCDTIASTPAPTRAEAEAWLRAGEPVRGALAVPAEPDYSGLCAAPSCEGHCGYVHARGCEAVREYLADHGGEPYRAPSPPDILRRVAERARERIAALAYDAGRPDLCARVRALDLNVLLDGGE